MCIRDRLQRDWGQLRNIFAFKPQDLRHDLWLKGIANPEVCLLYTSDAADERSSVDLGGRRIIKKQKNNVTRRVDGQI